MHSYNPELNTELLNRLFDLARNHYKSTPTFLTLRDYSQSLLREVTGYNSWQMAEFAGHENPCLYQGFLCRAARDEAAIRDDLINEHKLKVNLQNRKQAYVPGVTGIIINETLWTKLQLIFDSDGTTMH